MDLTNEIIKFKLISNRNFSIWIRSIIDEELEKLQLKKEGG